MESTRWLAIGFCLMGIAALTREVGGGNVPPFQGLGDLPGGSFHNEALALSDNGQRVVGRSSSTHSEEEGFIWSRLSGLAPLLGPGGTHVAGEPRGITPTGDVVAGKFVASGGPLQAARWTEATGWIALPDIPGGQTGSQALGISSDGNVLAGWGSSSAGLEAARWVNGNVVAMGDLSGGEYHSAAALVSDDGSTIVGTGYSTFGGEVFVWKAGTGMVGLGDLPGGDFSSEPFGMNGDASVIAGKASSSQGPEAMRWKQAGGMQGLGDLPGGAFESIALDVSADGRSVVGFGTTDLGQEAFLWTETHGMRPILDILLEMGMTEPVGWQLTEATGISAGGDVVIGNGINPSGQSEGWIAVLRGPVAAGWEPLRTGPLVLSRPTPNPSEGRVELRFHVPRTERQRRVTLDVFDVAGAHVMRLYDGVPPSDHVTVTWNGLRVDGSRVGAGLYFAMLQSENARRSALIVRLQ